MICPKSHYRLGLDTLFLSISQMTLIVRRALFYPWVWLKKCLFSVFKAPWLRIIVTEGFLVLLSWHPLQNNWMAYQVTPWSLIALLYSWLTETPAWRPLERTLCISDIEDGALRVSEWCINCEVQEQQQCQNIQFYFLVKYLPFFTHLVSLT